jgi:N-acetylmuramoyl-L-alanine amidase
MPTYLRPVVALVSVFALALSACSSDDPTVAPTSSPVSDAVETSGFPDATVRYLQEALDAAGFDPGGHDGLMGESTRDAIKALQAAKGIEQSGLIDEDTIRALGDVNDEARILVIEAIQNALASLGYYRGIVDGLPGPLSTAAIEAFQRDSGLTVTGEFTDNTYETLVERYDEEVTQAHLQAAIDAGIGGAADVAPPRDTSDSAAVDYLQQGDEDPEIAELQNRLAALGYRPGPANGSFGTETASAVLAFQKAEGLQRDAIVGDDVRDRLQNPQAEGPESSDPGPRVEVDLDRQIMFVIDRQGDVTTINVSTGSGKRFQSAEEGKGIVVAHTPVGNYTVQRSIDGVRNAPLGSLWRPLYFDGGWAIHGNPHVPAYPASHGCVRTADIDQDFVFSVLDVGNAVSIYGKNPPPPDNPAAGF